jgi:hypothetical protein
VHDFSSQLATKARNPADEGFQEFLNVWRVVWSVSFPEASNSIATEGNFDLRLKHGMRVGEYERLTERVLRSYGPA